MQRHHLPRTGVVLAAVCMAAVMVVPPPASAGEPEVDRRYVVGWSDRADDGARAAALADHAPGAEVSEAGDDLSVVEAATGAAADSQRTALAAEPIVDFVEADRAIARAAAVDDPGFDEQWGLDNRGQTVADRAGVAGVDVRATTAWERTLGSREVVVAVLDTGIDVEHPDLAGNIWRNNDERAGGEDHDGNGFPGDVRGWDFVDDDASVYDGAKRDRHGTNVAGLIAAVADNGLGIAGLAPDVRLMPVKFLDGASGSLSDALEAVRYAVDNGADVINASWGGNDHSASLERAIRDAGIPFITAAGNESRDLGDGDPVYPAAYRHPNLVSVAAIDNQGELAASSNYGDSVVDIAAPGRHVLTTEPDGGYGYRSGSSMATAFVSAGVALTASEAGVTGDDQLLRLLRRTAQPLDALEKTTVSGGMLDAAALLEKVASGGACPVDVVPRTDYDDVSDDHPHRIGIDCAVWWDVATGAGGARFRPDLAVTREHMAAFLAGVLDAAGASPDDAPDAFDDDDGSKFEDAIDVLAATGITTGDGEGSFGPDKRMSRAQMASFLVRTHEHLSDVSREPRRDWFVDDDGIAHEAAINRLRELGVASGTGPGTFGPRRDINRAQLSTFVSRLLDVLVRADHIPRH